MFTTVVSVTDVAQSLINLPVGHFHMHLIAAVRFVTNVIYIYIYFSFLGLGETVDSVHRPLTGLFYQPRMIDDNECVAVGGVRIGRISEVLEEN
jgi:hypothetical protein